MLKSSGFAGPDMIRHPFDGLAQAIREPNLGIYCPGGECSVVDQEAVADFADQVLDVLANHTYDLGVMLPKVSVSQMQLAHMVDAGRYRLPHAACAVHFDCPYGDDRLSEVMLLQQIGDKIGVTMFTSLDDEWNLIPLTLMIDPTDLPFEGDLGSADCFELDGFDVAVLDPEGLDDAMSVQTEFLHRVIEAITPDKQKLH